MPARYSAMCGCILFGGSSCAVHPVLLCCDILCCYCIAVSQAMEVKIGNDAGELESSGENAFVGGESRWAYDTWTNWEVNGPCSTGGCLPKSSRPVRRISRQASCTRSSFDGVVCSMLPRQGITHETRLRVRRMIVSKRSLVTFPNEDSMKQERNAHSRHCFLSSSAVFWLAMYTVDGFA